MSDPFTKPYLNPRTGNTSSGGAAREGRIKTLGGVDEIISRAVTKALIANADQVQTVRKPGK
jgi:hypothetical protein